MKKGRLNVIIDGQWGSTGKGKLAAYLAIKHKPDLAVCNFAPNAGHTHYAEDGARVVLQQLPSSLANPATGLAIGPNAIIRLPILLNEIKEHKVEKRLFIDPKAAIIDEEDLVAERELQRISSTQKGCGSALARKIMRTAKTAEDAKELEPYIREVVPLVHSCLKDGGTVIAESAQGFDLSLNHGHRYPFTTSRDVTTCSILSDCGVPPFLCGNIFGSIRLHPIRVGNVHDEAGRRIGWSGPHYPDQRELTWEEIEKSGGYDPDTLQERTTVTGKVRRVFSWSRQQFGRFLATCGPTHLFINHLNYLDSRNSGKTDMFDLTDETLGVLSRIMHDSVRLSPWGRPMLSYLGTGPKHKEMIDITQGGLL